MQDGKSSTYRAFLLRCWQENDRSTLKPALQQPWRFSVEEVGEGGSRQGFTDLEALIHFLHAELDRSPLLDEAE